MIARVIRPMEKLLGKPRETGSIIGEEEMAMLSSKITNSLVDQGYLEVDGISPRTGNGTDTHLRARVDSLQARIDKQDTIIADMTSRLSELMSLLPAKGKRKEP